MTAFLILVLMAGPLASQTSGPSYTVTTIAGRDAIGDGGPAAAAILVSVSDVKVDANGNLHIADFSGNRIRKVSPDGVISTVAGRGFFGAGGDDGPAAEAQFIGPRSLAADKEGNLYIADLGAARVQMVSAASGLISAVAGDGRRVSDGDGGPARHAGLMYPRSIAVDGRGNLCIADSQAHRVRKVTPDSQP